MSSIRMRLDNTAKKEAIDIFNKYHVDNNCNIHRTLKQLATDGYNDKYFRKAFFSYLSFLNFFKIDLIDFETAGWVKWSFVNIEKGEDLPEESLNILRERFNPPLNDK